ncbi:GIY-YIG nuclease family protein [Cupriavidus necator]
MEINLEWAAPIKLLKRAGLPGYQYEPVAAQVDDRPGIYVFARQYGDSYTPIYIGQAKSVVRRLKGQFDKTSLMEKVEHWNATEPGNPRLRLTGSRVLFVAYLTSPTRADWIKSALNIVERALIEHAMTEGFRIVNVQMTNIRYDEIYSSGARDSTSFAPREMYPRRRG